MRLTRRIWLVILLLMTAGVALVWWSWPERPTVSFVRFEENHEGRWAVLRVANPTNVTFFFTGGGAHRVRANSRWKTEYARIVRAISVPASDALPPGEEAGLAIQVDYVEGTANAGPFRAGIELVRPPSPFWTWVPAALDRVLPSTLRKRGYYWSEVIAP